MAVGIRYSDGSNRNTMSKFFLEKSIEINAPVSKVWRVFTNPILTRKMGGEYVSHWNVGSPFGWKGLDGKMLTTGTIMKIEPEKLLQHSLSNSVGSASSVITYEFGETRLTIIQDNNATQEAAKHSENNWKEVLNKLKEILEK